MIPIIIPAGVHISGGECRQMTVTEKVIMTPICSGLFVGFLLAFCVLAKDMDDSIMAKIAIYIVGFCISFCWFIPLIECW